MPHPRPLRDRTRLPARFLPLLFALFSLLSISLGPGRIAHAQLQFGQIQGTVLSEETGRPLAGVTVVITGPALQGDQTEVTNGDGRYVITELPPGDHYMVRLYFNDVIVERPGIRVAQNKTLTASVRMPMHRGDKRAIVVHERAPNVDTANASTGVEINQELLQNSAVRGRTFESVLSLAPGASDVAPRGVAGGDVGVSFSGSVGNENMLLVDGLNTTDLNFGLVSTQVHQYFIKEINVITGGYQAEYGRATGGVVSVITKSGSNEFHGSIFASVLPWQAAPRDVARLGEAIATRTRTGLQYDYGFDLGGPIVKDRLWFYAGFAPTITNTVTDRVLRTQLPDASGLPQVDPSYSVPGYLSDASLGDAQRPLARLTQDIPGATQQVNEQRRLYNWVGKLQINFSPDHQLILGYIGSPQFGSEYGSGSGYSSTGSSNPYSSELLANHIARADYIHDATAHYIGKFLARKLQVDVIYGFHYHLHEELPDTAGAQQVRYRSDPANPNSLADFENVPDCQRRTVSGQLFNPCPVTDYTKSGFGQYSPRRLSQRHALQASFTYFFNALGTHAAKLGLDFEDNSLDNTKAFTGSAFDANDPYSGRITWETDALGQGLHIGRGYANENPTDQYGVAGVPCGGQPGRYCYPNFRAETRTRNFATYLRDSWSTSFLPGLVINAGVRWEVQQLGASDGTVLINLLDNIAPRIGAAYDFTKNGRSKIYVHYGRYYESIPMDLNDRSLSTEGFLRGGEFASNCPLQPLSPGGRPVPVPRNGGPAAPCSLVEPRLSGGEFAPIAPGLKGQYQDEVVGGVQFDVGYDFVIGAFFTHRQLGTVVEDMSVDGGNTYFIANPGSDSNPDTVRQLQTDVMQAQAAAALHPSDEGLQSAAALAKSRLDVYKAAVLFPKPQRDYNAVTITANKRLSNNFAILASYTYSRLIGNYPGPFSPYVNQLDPNISSQYDIIDLTVNRNGPLNNDRPHNIKLTGFYVQPFERLGGALTLSLTFTGISGRPIQVLGAHAAYGGRQVLILPNGSGGRTPFVSQMDLHVGYDQKLGKNTRLNLFADVINLFNQQQVTNIDEEYTFSFVSPIIYGTPQDLKKLRTDDGSQLVVNSNYGQPTAYQAPIYLRLGGRLSF